MGNEVPNGMEFLLTLEYFVERKIQARDFAAVVKCYEENLRSIEAAAGTLAASILRHAARAYASLGNNQASLRTARLAQNKLVNEVDNSLLADICLVIGEALRNLGKHREAEKSLRDAESIFRRADDAEGQCRALNLLAGVLYHRGSFQQSLESLMDAIEIAERLQDRRKLAFMMGNIGRIETLLGKFSRAKQHLQTNIELSRELDDRVETARAQLALAYVYLQEDDFGEADALLSVAGGNIRTLNLPRDEAVYLSYLGELRYRQQRLDEAQENLNEAQALAERQSSESTLTARILRHQAELAVLREQYTAASRFCNRALSLIETEGSDAERGALWKVSAKIAEVQGDRDKTRECFLKALDLLRQTEVRFEHAIALIAAGQSTFFSKRRRLSFLFRAEEHLRACGLERKQREVEWLISQIDFDTKTRASRVAAQPAADKVVFITQSENLKSSLAKLPDVAKADIVLALIGETGVGKDQMARYYHSLVSPHGPFVPINCASVPDTLLEAELFGYVKGAFTGAVADKEGYFVRANGGVLYLDEIGDLPVHLQAKLLGVIERRSVTRLGSVKETPLDFKLVVATNRDLDRMVETGQFRRDLYYRLCGITMKIPSLRERKEDIPLLLRHFLVERALIAIDDEVPADLLYQFMQYDWPGNVRELQNKVKQLEVMAGGDLSELSESIFQTHDDIRQGSFFERVEEFERKMITDALLATGGNRSEAARKLGIHEATVRAKIKKYGIRLFPEGGAIN